MREDKLDNFSMQDESKELLKPWSRIARVERSTRIDAVAPQLVSTLLRQVGEARLRVAGTSMLPAIRPGDILLVRDIPIASVIVGDVVLVGREARLFAHRVVEKVQRPDGVILITRGDAHSHDDPPVTGPLLLGRVEGLRRDDIEVPVEPIRLRIAGGVSVFLFRMFESIRGRARSRFAPGSRRDVAWPSGFRV